MVESREPSSEKYQCYSCSTCKNLFFRCWEKASADKKRLPPWCESNVLCGTFGSFLPVLRESQRRQQAAAEQFAVSGATPALLLYYPPQHPARTPTMETPCRSIFGAIDEMKLLGPSYVGRTLVELNDPGVHGFVDSGTYNCSICRLTACNSCFKGSKDLEADCF